MQSTWKQIILGERELCQLHITIFQSNIYFDSTQHLVHKSDALVF